MRSLSFLYLFAPASNIFSLEPFFHPPCYAEMCCEAYTAHYAKRCEEGIM